MPKCLRLLALPSLRLEAAEKKLLRHKRLYRDEQRFQGVPLHVVVGLKAVRVTAHPGDTSSDAQVFSTGHFDFFHRLDEKFSHEKVIASITVARNQDNDAKCADNSE